MKKIMTHDTALIYDDLNLAPNRVNAYAYYARCAFKTIKTKLVKSRQNQKVKSHSSLENVFAIDPFG